MMNSNVISKNKVIIQDDFFDDLVNGLKSPIEETIEKQDAKNSRVHLGGKQLALFRNKVTPLITKQIEKNGLLEEFVKKVQNSYYTTRIREVQSAFEDSVSKYKNVEEEADDELEEVESDNKNYSLLVYKGFKIINTYRKFKNVYKVIQEMKGYIKPNKNNLSWNVNDYNLKSKKGLEKAGDDLVVYLIENLIRFVPAFEPLIRKTSEAIWAGAYKTFDKFNEAMYWMIAKEIAIWFAIEVASWLVGMFTLGAGYVGGKIVQAGRIARFMDKIKDITRVGLGIAKVTNKIKKAKAVRQIGIGAYKAGRKFRALGGRKALGKMDGALGHVMRNRKVYWEAYKQGRRAINVVDILSVDEDDVDEVHQWAKEKLTPLMDETYSEYQKMRKDYSTVLEVGDVFKQIGKELEKTIQDKFTPPASPEKYETNVKIKNLNFDFDAIKNLIKYFENGWNYYDFKLNTVIQETGNSVWAIGKDYIYDDNQKVIKISNNNGEKSLTEIDLSKMKMITTLNDGVKTSEIELDKFGKVEEKQNAIKVNKKIGRNGVNIEFGKYGVMNTLRVYYLFRGDDKWYDKIGYERWLKTSGFGEKVDVKLFLRYKNRGKNDKRFFKVEGNGDEISVIKISKDEEYTKFPMWFISSDGTKLIYNESKDLSEIINYRNSQLEQEIEFGKKVDRLKRELQKQLSKPRDGGEPQ